MKRKTTALITALTLALSLSACGDKTPVSTDTTETASITKTEDKKEIEKIEEETTSQETEEDIIKKEIEKVQSALGEMPYYGDTSNCKMTAEQATAYAQLIADGLAGDFSFRYEYDERFDIISWSEPYKRYDYPVPEEIDRFNIMLGDFAGDGIPYLYICSSTNDKSYEKSYEIYGWSDNIAELVFDTDRIKPLRMTDYIYEDENDHGKIKLTSKEIVFMEREYTYYFDILSFANGTIGEMNTRIEEFKEDNFWHVTENDVEINVYTQEEYDILTEERQQEKTHQHTLPYTCFYDMTPCTLEEMVNYLNAYATAMSDGQSIPVEIKKAEIVKHEGTGIITKGEVPQWKIDNLEILRQYINGELLIACGNADSTSYLSDSPERFYFGLADVNNDGIQELLLSHDGSTQIHFPPSYNCLMNVYGIDNMNGTYLVSEGSVSIIEHLYTYDGTSFSLLSSLRGWESLDDGIPYIQTENGSIQEISQEEFEAVMNDWNNRHTDVSKWADTHLDIENIENTFHVKINVRNSGEWLVTDTE